MFLSNGKFIGFFECVGDMLIDIEVVYVVFVGCNVWYWMLLKLFV